MAALVGIELWQRWQVRHFLYSADGFHEPAAGSIAEYVDGWLGVSGFAPIIALGLVCAACTVVVEASRGCLMVLLVSYAVLSCRCPHSVWLLDRYAQWLLVIATTLPSTRGLRSTSSASVALARGEILWIYVDAGLVKLRSGAWRHDAAVSALDLHLRHTRGASLVRRALGETGLRLLSPTVVLVELIAPAALLLALFSPVARPGAAPGGERTSDHSLLAAALLASLHLGIAATVPGAAHLSAFALASLLLWLDVALGSTLAAEEDRNSKAVRRRNRFADRCGDLLLALCLSCSAVYAAHSESDSAGARLHVGSVLLGNRWNVRVGDRLLPL